MSDGRRTMRPSQILRKLAAYPRQNELAAALSISRQADLVRLVLSLAEFG